MKPALHSKTIWLGTAMVLLALLLLATDILTYVALFKSHDGGFLISRDVADILLLVGGILTIIFRFTTSQPLATIRRKSDD